VLSSIRRAHACGSPREHTRAARRGSMRVAMVECMTPDSLREFCLALPQASETFPFGEETSVFKTSGNDKIFAISTLGSDSLDVTLKCDPEESIALRSEFAAITPGYHLNKKHWITIRLDGSVADELVEQLIASSHALVRPRIPRVSP
jgi:predicted DNA-binding protein (MmcQ/YjbR family)